MFPTFKKWFVPYSGNDYRPYMLRLAPVVAIVIAVGVLFAGSHTVSNTLKDQDSFLAAVISSVLIDLTNIDRASEGLHSLSVNTTLTEAAQLKANHMAENGYFAHNSPDGKSPWFWLGEAGYTFAYAGENLAVFFGDSEDVARAWMESPTHRANILNSNFTEIGIATAEGSYQGRQTVFVVQMFGTPLKVSPVATLESDEVIGEVGEESTGQVGGESVVVVAEEDLELASARVIHENESFIAVKNDNGVIVPSQPTIENQTSFLEHIIASPRTLVTDITSLVLVVTVLALVFLIVFEFRVQRPKNILLGILLLSVLIGILFFVDQNVVIAGIDTSSI